MIESKRWFPGQIGEKAKKEPLVFPLVIQVETVPRDDPPKIGPDENQLQWYEIKATLRVGDRLVTDPIYFPAHEPLVPQKVFTELMKAVMRE